MDTFVSCAIALVQIMFSVPKRNVVNLSIPKNLVSIIGARCHVCGSLFDTSAPDCPRYDKNDPAQIRTCDIGEACLYYSWQKAENDYGLLLYL